MVNTVTADDLSLQQAPSRPSDVPAPSVTQQTLAQRVERLERMFVTAYAVLAGLLLAAGVIVPYGSESPTEGEERSWSVLTSIFTPYMPDSESDDTTFAVLTVIGFVGLLIVTVLTVAVVLIPAAARALNNRSRRAGRVVVGLGIAGSLVPCIWATGAISEVRAEPGWGGLLLLIGMLAVLPLLGASAKTLVSTEES